jgi:hypothetical protein
MAQDLSAKKSDYVSASVAFAADLLALARRAEELAAYQSANGFQSGGAAPVTDADCVGGNAHMTAVLVNAVVTIAGQLGGAVTSGMRTTMRQASTRPTP